MKVAKSQEPTTNQTKFKVGCFGRKLEYWVIVVEKKK